MTLLKPENSEAFAPYPPACPDPSLAVHFYPWSALGLTHLMDLRGVSLTQPFNLRGESLS
jgi:hypothetical protein